MIVNVDLDGVVYDFVGALADYIRSVEPLRFGSGGPRSVPKATQWEFWNDWGMSFGEWRAWFRRGVEYGHIWRHGTPKPGAVEFLWRLSDDEHYIRLVTDRLVHPFGHRLAVTSTVAWLDEHTIPYRGISFDKKKHMFAQRNSVLVDDKPQNVENFALNHPYLGKNVQVAALFTTSANRNVEIDRPRNIARVHSWKEVYDWISSL